MISKIQESSSVGTLFLDLMALIITASIYTFNTGIDHASERCFIKLELSIAHAPRTACASCSVSIRTLHQYVCLLTTFTYILILAWAEAYYYGGAVDSVANKAQRLQRSWALSKDSKHNQASFSKLRRLHCVDFHADADVEGNYSQRVLLYYMAPVLKIKFCS